ncbi:MAG: hypothetical protein LC792_25220, partial [Actinobacteria bacterium]|nr:hypothetical protein [Actinomycetota bacterium]
MRERINRVPDAMIRSALTTALAAILSFIPGVPQPSRAYATVKSLTANPLAWLSARHPHGRYELRIERRQPSATASSERA